MKCKYERCIDKLERWMNKRKKQLKTNADDPYGIMGPEFQAQIGYQIRELDNVLSVLNHNKLKADKMKI